MGSTSSLYPVEEYSTDHAVPPINVKAATRIDEGHMVMVATATGYAEPGVGATASMRCVGWATDLADNSGGAAGDIQVKCTRRPCAFDMKSGDAFTNADIGATAYLSTSGEIMKTAGSNPITVGIFRGVTPSGRGLVSFA